MNTLFAEAIAADIATLERVVEAPTGDLGYGTDLSCVDDLTEDMAEIDPSTARGIGEAAIRRLTTPRGGLVDDPDYGLDLRGYCNHGVTSEELRTLASRASAELLKDDRIDSATVTLSTNTASTDLRVTVTITPADPNVATFALVFAVTDSAVLIETI